MEPVVPSRVPFLVTCTRNLRDAEQLLLRDRRGPGFETLFQHLVFHETGRPTMPAVSINPALFPDYPLMRMLREHIPLETLRRVLYCTTECNMALPNGSTVTPEIARAVRAMYNAVDERSELLNVEFQPRHGIGRFYAVYDTARTRIAPGGLVGSQLSIPKGIRATMWAKHGVVDLDQQKSHPTLLACVGRLFGLYTPALVEYLQDPERIMQELAEYWTEDPGNPILPKDVKKLVNRTVYGGGFAGWAEEMQTGTTTDLFQGVPTYSAAPKPVRAADKPQIYTDMYNECHTIMDLVYQSNPDILAILRPLYPLAGDHSMKCKLLSYFCGCIEHYISYTALAYCHAQGAFRASDEQIQVVWGYDGFSWIPPRGTVIDPAFLHGLNTHLHGELGTAFDLVRFVRKDIPEEDCIAAVLDDRDPMWTSPAYRIFEIPAFVSNPHKISRREEVTTMSTKSYAEWKEWFELTHFKVEDPTRWGCVQEAADSTAVRVYWYTRDQLKQKYENYLYTHGEKRLSAIKRWIADPAMRVYQTADVYPPPMQCPHDTYNMWTESPFFGQRRAPRDSDAGHIATFLGLLSIVCDGDQLSMEYLMFWIAHMLQVPAEKIGITPIFVGSEGTGKSMFCTILGLLVGRERYLETTINNVVGEFNSLLEGKLLVCLNELNGGLGAEKTAVFKQLLTDSYLTINRKGAPQYTVRSYHRVVASSNFPNVVDSDRRPFYCRSSIDILLPEHEALKEACIALQSNNDGIAAIYAMFMGINIPARFGSARVKPPVNSLNRGYKALRQPYAQFAWFLVDKYWDTVQANRAFTPLEIFQHFESWSTEQHMTLSTPSVGAVEANILIMSWPAGCISDEFNLPRGGKARMYNFVQMRLALNILYPRNNVQEISTALVPDV